MRKKKEDKKVVAKFILDLIDERTNIFNQMVTNQTKATKLKIQANKLEKENKQRAGFINTLDMRISNEWKNAK